MTKPKQSINLTNESFNVALFTKDEELEELNEELNKHYMKELQDLKNVIAAKEIELSDSQLLNSEYEHQIKNFKEKPIERERKIMS